MNEKTEMHERTCCRCKCTYKTENKKSYVCPDCKKKIERSVNTDKVAEQNKKKHFRPAADIELMDLVRLIDRYNEREGTNYTYGQFMQKVRDKKINIAKEIRNEGLSEA